ncbi:MAG TPA: hypothetical protein VGA38_08930 [Candidatus Limnocylindria bacterium]
MSDDRLLSVLKRLGDEELSLGADRTIRDRLERAWKPGVRPAAFAFPQIGPLGRIRRFVPVLAALALIAGSVGAVLGAGADSPLWDTRVALEEAAAVLRLSPDDRIAYLFELVQSRTEEAARQEAAGHPDAAAKARAAATSAVMELDGNVPQIEVDLPTPVPAASPTASPPPASSPSPSPSPSTSVAPAAPPPTRIPTPTARPTVTPTPTPTAKPTITFTGMVKDGSGAGVTDACITTSTAIPTSTASCITKTKNGSYGFSVPATPGQSITLFAYWKDATGQTFAGGSSTTATKPTTLMPTITLTLRR